MRESPRRGVGAVLCAGLPALATPAQAAFSGENGRLAFERDGGIWTMSPDGSDPVELVASGDDPSWSPDGRKVVYEQSGAIYAVTNVDQDILELGGASQTNTRRRARPLRSAP